MGLYKDVNDTCLKNVCLQTALNIYCNPRMCITLVHLYGDVQLMVR